MSSKVVQSDRTSKRSREPTGEVESLRAGHREVGRMGDRVVPAKPATAAAVHPPTKKKTKQQQQRLEGGAAVDGGRGGAGKRTGVAVGGESILDLGNLGSYQPTTEQARVAYESILTTLGSKELLGSQGPQVLRDAAEEVIATLKDANLRDPERHEGLSQLLTRKSSKASGGLSTLLFTTLVQLGKRLDDYDKDEKSQEQVDENMVVAVVFDESDDEQKEGSDVDENVVVDPSSSSEDEKEEEAPYDNDDDDNDEDKFLQGDEQTKKRKHGVDRVLSVHEIDAHFLQRQLAKHKSDAGEAAKLAGEVLDIIDVRNAADVRECENRLLVLLGFEVFDTIKLVLQNRVRVWACTAMKRAQSDQERTDIEKVLMEEPTGEGRRVWEELHSVSRAQDWSRDRIHDATAAMNKDVADVSTALDSLASKQQKESEAPMEIDSNQNVTELDLDTLALAEGSRTMSNKKCVLPDASWRAMRKGYEEVHVPAVRSVVPSDEKLVRIADLPQWTQAAFKGMDKLNRIQSKMCKVALETSENLLLCAPTGESKRRAARSRIGAFPSLMFPFICILTGAGKTNVACLAMLNILGQFRRERSDLPEVEFAGEAENKDLFDLSAFKIVYVAPMKALVQEVVKNFSERLKDYGITVRELSGDSSLTRQQIAETQLIVTTPEKFDVVTRQGEGRAYTQLVKLVIIDEIHLLHDDRGPVLESIVARVIRQVESSAEPIRLIGLSATLPNYADVASFLRVKPDKGMFFFDHSYRPVPLQMQYIGITERNAFKRFQLQNEICFEKALDQRRNNHQVLIFVHSRAETGKTAKALRDMARDKDQLASFVRDGGATQEILREEAAGAKNADLKDVLPYGFAIHHAGMAREDRELVEDLFADRHIAVLCTTATLAWGVNLPCHAVIIRGTQIYDPAKGRWAELSPLDVLQMLGRAGRPQYDSEGEGIILTQHGELQYYLSLTNLQLPVESQFIKSLPDHLNAEVVLGTVQSLEEAADWLSYTFLFVRMLRNPSLYGMSEDYLLTDPTLRQRRLDLAHTSAAILEKDHLIKYDRKTGVIQSTPLGRVAAQFYLTHSSTAVYTRHMRPSMSDIELLRLFSMSGEFAQITVREEEKLELNKLAARVPIPIKESPNEPSAKINILLQAYISRLTLDGFALAADMAFIRQSAARIMRALFEIALRRKWASLSELCLNFSNMVSYRIWRSQTPLRQFKNVPELVCRKLERKSDIDWSRYVDLTPADLGELVGVPRMGRVLHKLVHQFPRLELSAQIQPITRSLLRIELTLVPAFQFDVEVHGYAQLFHIIVEDVNGEAIIHHETFSLKSRSADEEHVLVFAVPILDPLPPAYYVRVISDKWLHSTALLAVSFNTLLLPAKFPPPTELLDLQPLLPGVLGEPALTRLYSFREFNPIQTQSFHELFKTDRNCLVCAPSGSGKRACAEFAVLRMLTTNSEGKCVYVAPTDEIAIPLFEAWDTLFGTLLRKGAVVRLSGETTPDLKSVAEGKIIVCSVRQWDLLSRRWRQRKAVQLVSLMLFDELHFLGGELGPILEVVISRTRFMSGQLQANGGSGVRIVGLSAPLANARDVGEWMGVPSKSLFNFSPNARPIPLEISFYSFEQGNFAARLLAMSKPLYNVLSASIGTGTAVVFVPSRRQSQLTAIDLMTFRERASDSSFLGKHDDKFDQVLSQIREPALRQVAGAGVGYVYEGMLEADQRIVSTLYLNGTLRILVCAVEMCWKFGHRANLVVIMGTEAYDGRERRHVDYPLATLLHMVGRYKPEQSGKCTILCHAPKRDYLKKLLADPLPIESHLDSYLHDPLNAEIVTKTVSSMQHAIDYMTWTFLYRRLPKNPSYYGLRDTSNIFLSEHLSEMIESVVGDLEESKCCQVSEEGEISPLNLGMIAAYYNVQYRTIELIASSISEKTKIRGVLEILSASWEFSTLPMRYGEERSLRSLARNLTYKLPADASYDSNAKALIMLQCHFSRKLLPSDMRPDLSAVLKEATTIIQAIVDVISSNGWLKPALASMELSQMIVQGLWNKDNVLKQIPHFSDDVVRRCQEYKGDEPIDSVLDILTLDDDVRNQLLQLPDEKMAEVAVFCNNYPNIEVNFKVKDPDSVTAGDPVQIVVDLQREGGEEDMESFEIEALGKVSSPFYPTEKKEHWWLVIGDTSTNSLMSLKRTNLSLKQSVTLEFLAPEEAGDYDLTLFCMCDSYLGCDQEYSVSLSVAAAESDDDDNESNQD